MGHLRKPNAWEAFVFKALQGIILGTSNEFVHDARNDKPDPQEVHIVR
jgi:hypothetical protein